MKKTKLSLLIAAIVALCGDVGAQTNACTATFTYSVYAPQQVQFVAVHDSTNTPLVNYYWNFGDGSVDSGNAISHQYPANGDWEACVTVSNANCTYTFCDSVHVGEVPPPTYSLSGYVYKGTLNTCRAVAYLINDSSGYLSLVDISERPDSNAASCWRRFNFSGVPEGYYYLKAALGDEDPDYANYLPTYYGGAINWTDATPIHVTATDYSLHVTLTEGVNPGGPGFVGGWVTEGAGLTIGGNNETRASGDPIADVQINLLTDNNIPVAFTHTDANGRYTFSNLALGTYKVYAEQINKVPYSTNVTLDANNQSRDNVNVVVNSNSAVTGVNDLKEIQVLGVYPNPVLDKTSINVTMKQSTKLAMVLTDINGRTIQNRNLELATGPNEIKLDLSQQAAGVYLVNLTNESSKKIVRLVKVK